LDFSIKNYAVVTIGGIDIWITETIVNAWIIMLALIIFAVVARIKLRKFTDVPKGFQNFIEMLIEMFDNLVRGVAGEKFMFLGNWYFMVFAFVLVSNICGIVGMRPPTADWATAFAFALATFFLIHFMGAKYRKGKYLKSFFEPVAFFLPLNIIGEIARPISLSFRLFGNVLGGMILMSLVYSLPIFVRFIIPSFLHAYFDLFSGALQTYIFCILSLSFINSAADPDAE